MLAPLERPFGERTRNCFESPNRPSAGCPAGHQSGAAFDAELRAASVDGPAAGASDGWAAVNPRQGGAAFDAELRAGGVQRIADRARDPLVPDGHTCSAFDAELRAGGVRRITGRARNAVVTDGHACSTFDAELRGAGVEGAAVITENADHLFPVEQVVVEQVAAVEWEV